MENNFIKIVSMALMLSISTVLLTSQNVIALEDTTILNDDGSSYKVYTQETIDQFQELGKQKLFEVYGDELAPYYEIIQEFNSNYGVSIDFGVAPSVDGASIDNMTISDSAIDEAYHSITDIGLENFEQYLLDTYNQMLETQANK